jgi:O-antigen/teichoic acid export membrane protein
MSIKLTDFIKTSSYAFVAQVVSIVSSIILSLLIPKYVSIEFYGVLQYFLLIASYVGILHFGFNDGVYLKLGGSKFDNISRHEYLPQFILIFCFQFLCALTLFSYTHFFVIDAINRQIFFLVSIYIIIDNFYKILGFTLMATDKMQNYSKAVIVDKSLLILFTILIILEIIPAYTTTLIKIYILTHLIALILIFYFFRNFFSNWYKVSFNKVFSKIFSNMFFGISLTISNILGALIIGSGRFFVEHYWDIYTFAKISLALSLSLFLLMFFSEIGMVLFPFLRNISNSIQKIILEKSSFLLGILVMVSFIFFFPIYFFVQSFLPLYSESLNYLIFLFPISLYEIRFIMLYNTYFKSLKKQRILLFINLITFVVAMLLYGIAIYIHSTELIVLGMLLSIMFRSIISKLYLNNHFSISINSYVIIEILFSGLFILIFKFFDVSFLFLYYVFFIITIYCFYWSKIKKEFFSLRSSVLSKNII